jgi:hypothetical protein
MRLRKLILTALLALILILNTTQLGVAFVLSSSSTVIVTLILKTSFFTYLLILSVNSVTQNFSKSHASPIRHLSALLFLSALLLVCTAILPDDAVQVLQSEDGLVLDRIWYSNLVLVLLAWILVFDTPQGPILHYPSSLIYSEKTLEKTTNHERGNVCGAVGMASSSKPSVHPLLIRF